MQTREIAQLVLRIYREHIDTRPLPRRCEMRTECCRFNITGKTPMVTLGEAITAAVGWRASGRKEIPSPIADSAASDGACPFLDNAGRCGNYTHRPLGCRTHFCDAAGGAYPRAHVIDAIHALETLDEELGGDGTRPLPAASRDVWTLTKSNKHGNRSRSQRKKR